MLIRGPALAFLAHQGQALVRNRAGISDLFALLALGSDDEHVRVVAVQTGLAVDIGDAFLQVVTDSY